MNKMPILYFFNHDNDIKIYKNAINKSRELNPNNEKILQKLKIELVSIHVSNCNDEEEFYNWLLDIIEKCWIFAKNIKNNYGELEPVEALKPNSHFSLCIYSEVNYRWKEKYPSIIDITVDITFNIAKKHLLINGNKRTALMFMAVFLKICGFILPYFDPGERKIKNDEAFLDVYYAYLIDFSECDTNNQNKISVVKNRLKKFLENNLMIDFDYLFLLPDKYNTNENSVILKKINNECIKSAFDHYFYKTMYKFLSKT